MPRLWILQIRQVRLYADGAPVLRRRHYRERRGAQEDGADYWRATG